MPAQASARHRAPRRPSTPLTPLTDAISDHATQLQRGGLVVAVSSGLLATGGIPLPDLGSARSGTPDVTAVLTDLPATGPAADAALVVGPALALGAADGAAPGPADAVRRSGAVPIDSTTAFTTAHGTPMVAPPDARLDFDRSWFTAVPRPTARPAGRHRTPPAPAPAAAHPSAAVAARTPVHAGTGTATPVLAAAAHPSAAGTTRAPVRATATRNATTRTTTATRNATTRTGTTSRTRTTRTTAHLHAGSPARSAKPARPVTRTVAGARGSAAIAVAARYLGVPYVYGGTSPKGFDCSGYVQYVYRQLGIRLPRTADQQLHAATRIPRSQARPGDLVAFVSGGSAYHIGIYAGGGMMYDAPKPGGVVRKRAIWSAAVVFARVTG